MIRRMDQIADAKNSMNCDNCGGAGCEACMGNGMGQFGMSQQQGFGNGMGDVPLTAWDTIFIPEAFDRVVDRARIHERPFVQSTYVDYRSMTFEDRPLWDWPWTKVYLFFLIPMLILTVALGLTGIVITHRIVGPAYKLKLLLGDVERGRLNVRGGLRKGDELQDVGEAFQKMVQALRDRQEAEIAELEEILEKAGDADGEVVERITALRDQMRAALET